jgi:hypothetical protein
MNSFENNRLAGGAKTVRVRWEIGIVSPDSLNYRYIVIIMILVAAAGSGWLFLREKILDSAGEAVGAAGSIMLKKTLPVTKTISQMGKVAASLRLDDLDLNEARKMVVAEITETGSIGSSPFLVIRFKKSDYLYSGALRKDLAVFYGTEEVARVLEATELEDSFLVKMRLTRSGIPLIRHRIFLAMNVLGGPWIQIQEIGKEVRSDLFVCVHKKGRAVPYHKMFGVPDLESGDTHRIIDDLKRVRGHSPNY